MMNILSISKDNYEAYKLVTWVSINCENELKIIVIIT